MRRFIQILEETERLNELTGAKEKFINPLRQNFAKHSYQQWDFNQKNSMENYLDFLEDEGFTPLGSGSFALVFTHPNLQYCVKVFRDPAYKRFIKFCNEHHGNQNLPTFKGMVTKIGDDLYSIRMETLSTLPVDAMPTLHLARMYATTKPTSRYANLSPTEWMNRQKYDLDKYFSDGLFNTVKEIVEFKKSYHLDLHDGNAMLRYDTIVITDPYCVKGFAMGASMGGTDSD